MDNKKRNKTVVLVFLLLVVCIVVTAVICLNISKNKNEENTQNEQSSVDANKVNENVEKTEELVKEDVETEKSDETSKETTSNTSTNDSLRSKYPDAKWATDIDIDNNDEKYWIEGTKLFVKLNYVKDIEIDIKLKLKSVKSYIGGGILYAYVLTDSGEVYSVDIMEKKVGMVEALKSNKIVDICEIEKSVYDGNKIYFLTDDGKLLSSGGYTYEFLNKDFVKWVGGRGNHAYVDKEGYLYSESGRNGVTFTIITDMNQNKIKPSKLFIQYNPSDSSNVFERMVIIDQDNKLYYFDDNRLYAYQPFEGKTVKNMEYKYNTDQYGGKKYYMEVTFTDSSMITLNETGGIQEI